MNHDQCLITKTKKRYNGKQQLRQEQEQEKQYITVYPYLSNLVF